MMSIDPQSSRTAATAIGQLPDVPGGWHHCVIDLGWTKIELATPRTPDALLDLEEVQEANRRDDSMPYWATLWPAAEKMARLLGDAPWPPGTEVLEIGCGLGLVGIAALRRGWNVHLTDGDLLSIRAAEYNARLNGFSQNEISLFDWRQPAGRRYPVILACDVLYEVRLHALVLDVVDARLTNNGRCWIADPGRTPMVDFVQSAESRGYRIGIRDADGNECHFLRRGQFQLLELRKSL